MRFQTRLADIVANYRADTTVLMIRVALNSYYDGAMNKAGTSAVSFVIVVCGTISAARSLVASEISCENSRAAVSRRGSARASAAAQRSTARRRRRTTGPR